MAKKTIATINTNNVKVQFMTSSKDFTATMSKYWVAINEMADNALILRKNITIEQAWMENHTTEEETQMALDKILEYQTNYDKQVEEYNKRVGECYALLGEKMYEAYKQGEQTFKLAISEWFTAQNIGATPTLVNFMMVSVGYKNASNKQLYKLGNTLVLKGKKTFEKSFMYALCQLMKDKNALKTDAYKYKYVPLEKK